jgi:hypothetical protein
VFALAIAFLTSQLITLLVISYQHLHVQVTADRRSLMLRAWA